MFTGLVQHVGRIAERRETPFGASLIVAVGAWPEVGATSDPAHSPPHTQSDTRPQSLPQSHPQSGAADAFGDALRSPGAGFTPPLQLGESIAVSGCCLTLAEVGRTGATADEARRAGERTLRFDVIHQTLRVTALGGLAVGHRVNLERSVTPATLLGGHIVQGHVDGLGRVVAIETTGGEWRVRVAVPAELHRYLHDKGSIAIDGVSLTVAALRDADCTCDVCLIPETLARTTLGDRSVGDAVHIEVDALAKMVARLLGR
jgi:riboflavin synthase